MGRNRNARLSRSMIARIFHKTDGHCAYCGVHFDPFGDWEIEHVIPQSRGGSDKFDNLVIACKRCNVSKRQRTKEEFRKYIKKRVVKNLEESINLLHRMERYTSVDFDNVIIEIETKIEQIELTPIEFYIDWEVLDNEHQENGSSMGTKPA